MQYRFNNKLWLIGDGIGGAKNDVWSSADGINWAQKRLPVLFFSPRAGHQAAVFNGIYITGGYASTGFKNEVWSVPMAVDGQKK